MSEKNNNQHNEKRKWGKWIILAAVLLAVAGIVVLVFTGSDDQEDLQASIATVDRGTMLISVNEGGELESERRKIISNELRWPVIIRDVVAEGTVVKKDQKIIEFECKELLDEIVKVEFDVTNAKNSYTQATQNLQLKKEEMNNKILQAKRALEEAREDRTKYIKHEHPILLFEKDNDVKISTEDLEIAQHNLESMININKQMKEDSPYSSSQIRTEKLKILRLENTLRKSELEKKKLDIYDHPRKLRDMDAKASDAELALKRTELEAKGQLLIATANVQAQKRTLEMYEKRLDELKKDEKKLLVNAEEEGLVVYQTGSNWRRNEDIVIAKGEKINPRQQLMMIPDMSTLQIKTKVYEAVVSKIKPGLDVFIKLDINPNKPLKGKVKKVAVLPSSQNRWLTPDIKTFEVVIAFEEKIPNLKPGMTCQVEININRLENVLSVPVAAVFHEEDRIVCYRADTHEPVEVKIGETNTTHAQILSGLNEGDEVLLVKPNSSKADTDEEDDSNSPDVGAGI